MIFYNTLPASTHILHRTKLLIHFAHLREKIFFTMHRTLWIFIQYNIGFMIELIPHKQAETTINVLGVSGYIKDMKKGAVRRVWQPSSNPTKTMVFVSFFFFVADMFWWVKGLCVMILFLSKRFDWLPLLESCLPSALVVWMPGSSCCWCCGIGLT